MSTAKAKRPTSVAFLARKSLAVSAGLLFAAVAVLVGGHYWSEKARADAAKSVARRAAANENLKSTEQTIAKLDANFTEFQRLSASRFIGVPDRLALLDAIEKSSQDWPSGLLRWEIQAQRVVKTIADETGGEPLAEARVIPMKLSATNIQENEWVSFLEQLRYQGVGYFRVDACEMRKTSFNFIRAAVPAVNASCNISWVFIVPLEAGEAKK